MVESEGIARLPRFNAKCLKILSIDKRITELKQECFALKVKSFSYRHDYLKCMDQLDVMITVLQQHTNALRDLTGPTSTGNTNKSEAKDESTHTPVSVSPSANTSTVDSPCLCCAYAFKHSYGKMIFDIKRYKHKFKNKIQTFIYQVFKVMSLQNRLNNYVVKTCVIGSLMSKFTYNN